MISQVATMGFLAVWHGFHAGYYITFINEFVTVMVERQFLSIWGKSSKVVVWKSHPAYTTITSVLGWVWVWVFLPHAFIPFSLLLWSTSLHVYCLCCLVPLFKGSAQTGSWWTSQGKS